MATDDYWQEPIADLLHALVEARTGEQKDTAAEALITHVLEEHACGALIYHGSRNPDAGNFGPDERCDEIALPGGERCAQHAGPDY